MYSHTRPAIGSHANRSIATIDCATTEHSQPSSWICCPTNRCDAISLPSLRYDYRIGSIDCGPTISIPFCVVRQMRPVRWCRLYCSPMLNWQCVVIPVFYKFLFKLYIDTHHLITALTLKHKLSSTVISLRLRSSNSTLFGISMWAFTNFPPLLFLFCVDREFIVSSARRYAENDLPAIGSIHAPILITNAHWWAHSMSDGRRTNY